ncbi:filamentous hemagglutinin N-terminal domain-containing protein [Massilia sp. METH4]|uniref:beta strand repeat-containing protein n=1 Tax=Massilia sp. METH4 TaxID=3123041 RepID=UPI0030D31C8C
MKTKMQEVVTVPVQRPLARAIARACNARAAGLAMVLTMGAPVAGAGPRDGVVQAGAATIRQAGAVTTVDQASQRAAINWQSFNVGRHESVNFNQPNAQAVILNRVVGNDASAIYGRINANGQVYLVNPNGILFGRGARVDVGGLVASTANISNADFMSGKLDFNQPGKPGATVRNLGEISVADGGLAALVGRGVENSGVINARLGKVALAAGEGFVLDLYGDKLVNLVVDPTALEQLRDAQGRPLSAYVDHAGTIRAEGGVVQLTVATAKSVVDSLINVSGVIRATAVDSRAGLISLRGDAGTILKVGGTLDASGQIGGRIEATAGGVQLSGHALADASGRDGGGSIAIGGDWQGRGALANAASTSVARGAVLRANATGSGNGGVVSVWSDGDTRFAGAIEARGGTVAGNGGQVEVSGKLRLGFDGDVDTAALAGRAGSLLLDPGSLVVSQGGGDATLPGAGAAGDFTINALAINRQLVRGTNVALQADQDITVQADARIDGRATAGGTPGGGLALSAGRNVTIDGYIVLDNGNFGASAGGAFTQGAASVIATGNGAVDIAGATGVSVGNLLTTGRVALASGAGAVHASQALSGGAALPLASLEVRGRDGVRLAQGALVAGATTLASLAGKVELGAPLASGGPVLLDGGAGVQAGSIVTPGAVSVTSTGGDVVLAGAIGGAPGEVGAASARAASLTVRTDGAVTLSGAALGDGGLAVGGVADGARAGSATFGGGSVFSDGRVNVATVNDISLAGAGITSGAALALDSSAGAVHTGAERIAAAGALRIAAGTTASIGPGGASGGAGGLAIQAGGGMTVDGTLDGADDGVVLASGGALTVNGDIAGGTVDATAGGRFAQGPESVISAGHIAIRGTGGIDATNLQTPGQLLLSSTGGAVSVAQAISGGGTARTAALDADGRDGVRLAQGALVAGTTTLVSAAGLVDTGGATLASDGAVTLSGQAGVTTGPIVTPAAVLLTSGAGNVILGGAVSGAPGAVDGAARASSLTIRSGGAVSVNGAALGAGGLTVGGAADGTAAASASFGPASVISQGRVAVLATGDIVAGDGGIDSDAGIEFEARNGAVRTGAGLLASDGGVVLKAGTGLTVGGNGIDQGGIQAGGDLTLEAAGGDLLSTGLLQTAGGTILARASDAHRVTLNDVITWQTGLVSSGALVVEGGQVVLAKPLGQTRTNGPADTQTPAATGYTTLAARYQPQNRPPVGRVRIVAARDVELNGLNLDGLSEGGDTSASDSNPGLEVLAGNRIVSNGLIGVNKGNIILRATGTGPLDGIYLGNSVYSRGLDLADGKTGYAVTVGGTGDVGTRSAIYLFDNTDDNAFLPGDREIAKVVIANNVKNYSDQSTLVAATNSTPHKVTVGADRLLALRTLPGPLRLGSMPAVSDVLDDLGLASILRAPDAQGNRYGGSGIGLKVQVFHTSGADRETTISEMKGPIWPNQETDETYCGDGTYAECGILQVEGNIYLPPNTETCKSTEPCFLAITSQSSVAPLSSIAGFKFLPGNEGRAAGFTNLVVGREAPSLTTELVAFEWVKREDDWQQPFPGGSLGYRLERSLVQVDAGQRVTRILFGPGTLQTKEFEASFDTNGILVGGSNETVGNSTTNSGANSNPGFASIGGFGTAPAGNAPIAIGNLAALQGQFGPLPVGAVGGVSGNNFVLPAPGALPPEVPSPVPPDGTPADTEAALAGPDTAIPSPVDQGPDDGWLAEQVADLALGRRPAADADLGRISAASGATPNVFRLRYRIARNQDASLCAPDDVATLAQRSAGDKGGRSCPSGQ